MKRNVVTKLMFVIVALIMVMPSQLAWAGSNGQPLSLIAAATNSQGFPLPGFTKVVVTGPNQNNQPATWTWGGSESRNVVTTNWYWKGIVTIQATYANGSTNTCKPQVPQVMSGDFFVVTCSAVVPNRPEPPANVRFAAVGTNSLTVAWNDTRIKETGFKVEVSLNNKDWSLAGTTGTGVAQFAVAGLLDDVAFYFRVRAMNPGGESDNSGVLSGRTACGTTCQMLNTQVTLTNNSRVAARNLDGNYPVKGMDSIYGKPGQVPLQNVPVSSVSGARRPELYMAVIYQFGVAHNPRYTPDGPTYCNTFAGDVMRAMGVPLPQKSSSDRATIAFPALISYMNNQPDGWKKVALSDWKTVLSYVSAGKPALVLMPGPANNPTDGHVAVVRPNQPAGVSDWKQLHIAQAGASSHITNDTTIYFAASYFMVHE